VRRDSSGEVMVCAVPWRRTAIMATATGPPQAIEHVYELAGAVLVLRAAAEE
jgi:hypothetical protein